MLLVRKQARNPIVACQDLETPTPKIFKYKKLIDSQTWRMWARAGADAARRRSTGVAPAAAPGPQQLTVPEELIGLAAHECCSRGCFVASFAAATATWTVMALREACQCKWQRRVSDRTCRRVRYRCHCRQRRHRCGPARWRPRSGVLQQLEGSGCLPAVREHRQKRQQ